MITNLITQENFYISCILGLAIFIGWLVKWVAKSSHEREKLLIDTGLTREKMYNENFKERVRPLEEKLGSIHKCCDLLRKEVEIITEKLKN